MKNIPDVSIIVPVYNVDKYLNECLNSICRQTLKNIEIICVDDGSTDTSLYILEDKARKDNRIRVIHKDNKGYGHTMNLGIGTARGEYIGIVESDDIIEGKMMEELYKLAIQNDVEIIKADYKIFKGENGNREFQYVQLSENLTHYNKVINPSLEKDVFEVKMNTWAGLYKRSFLVENNIKHNETPGASYQDNGFWFQGFALAHRVFFVNKAYYMLRRDNPDSSVMSKDKVNCIVDEFVFIKQFLNEKKDIKNKFLDIYCLYCYKKYMFNLRRIAYKNKLEFLEKFSEDFNNAEVFNELDISLFNEMETKNLRQIMDNPLLYFRENLELSEKFLEIAEMKSNIILFGGGTEVYKVYKKLRFNNIPILYFAKLRCKSNENKIMGVEVRNIQDLVEYNTVGFIIVVENAEKRKNIKNNLDRLGFLNYIFYFDYQ